MLLSPTDTVMVFTQEAHRCRRGEGQKNDASKEVNGAQGVAIICSQASKGFHLPQSPRACRQPSRAATTHQRWTTMTEGVRLPRTGNGGGPQRGSHRTHHGVATEPAASRLGRHRGPSARIGGDDHRRPPSTWPRQRQVDPRRRPTRWPDGMDRRRGMRLGGARWASAKEEGERRQGRSRVHLER
jgi:hypothetical protein